MKKFINIITLAAVAALTVVSCQKEVETHEPGPADVAGCNGVFFPSQDASGSHTYDPEMDRSVDIVVSRSSTSGSINVPFTATVSDEGIFNFGTIDFLDGQSETTLHVTFPNAPEGKSLSFSVQLDDNNEYVSHYNDAAIALDFSVLIVQWVDYLNPKTGEPAVITLTEGWWGEVHTATLKYYEVGGVRTAVLTSNETDEDGNPTGIWGDSANVGLTFRWYVADQDGFSHKNDLDFDFLEVPKQYFGFDYADWTSKPVDQATYPIYVYDYPWYWYERGYDFNGTDQGTCWLDEANTTGTTTGSYPVGYYDGNGGFFFNLRYYIPGLGGFSTNPYEFVGIAEGYTRVDYSLKLEADYTVDGVTPIYVEAGADVAKLKYAVYEGELTATQVGNKVEAIIAGTEATEIFSDLVYDEEEAKAFGVFGVAPETTGTYTVVAVALDGTGEAQESTSISFKHIGAGDTADYAVDIEVGTELVPERYGDKYTDSDSFAYYVLGKNITEAHIGIFSAEDYAEDVEEINAIVKAAPKGEGIFVADDSVIAGINAQGGYFTVVSGLKALSEYVVVVWATNGDADKIATASWTTSGLPNEKIGTGTFRYTAFFNGDEDYVDDAGLEIFKNPNYENTYVIEHWGYDVDLVFTVDPETGVIELPDTYVGYSSANYGPVYIIDAKNYWSASTLEKYPEMGESSYLDSKTGVYYFNVVYAVSAGYFGYGWEYFIPDEDTSTTSVAVKKNLSFSGANAGLAGYRPYDFSRKEQSFERDPQPIKVSVTVSYNRKEKSVNRTLLNEVR